ncbi:MAG: glycosyltransferase family 4 protein [Betaproteobacteria bacterium]
MRFGMVTTFYPPRHFGGDALHVQSLARALVRAGHDVEVVSFPAAYRAAGGHVVGGTVARGPTLEPDGVIVHRLEHPMGVLAAVWMHQAGTAGPYRAALAAILDRGFDVLHFHNVSLAGGPEVLGAGRARRRVLTLHDFWFVCPMHALWKNRERACDRPECTSCCLRSHRPVQLWRLGGARDLALAGIDVVIAPSAWSARTHRDRGITVPIDVLPLFSRFTASDCAQASLPARARYLYAGRLTASKGVRLLLSLFARLPEYDLVVAGDGDERAALVAEYGGLPNVQFAGQVDDAALRMLFVGATATLMASLGPESFGLVAIESMTLGTPVLALDAGGVSELIRESGGGVVCADLDALEKAIRRIAADGSLRETLSRRGRAAGAERYSERRFLDDYLALVTPRPAVDRTAVA